MMMMVVTLSYLMFCHFYLQLLNFAVYRQARQNMVLKYYRPIFDTLPVKRKNDTFPINILLPEYLYADERKV